MNIKEYTKRLIREKNPLVIRRRKKMRKALTNTTPSFLCPNCIGGILFHDLGLKFLSPTVNLMMTQRDFVKFILDMDHYLGKEFLFFKHPEYTCPCAHLGDIVIHFTHYHSEQEAVQKWKERSQRLDRDNLFVFLTERDGITKEEIASLSNLHARGLVVFTVNAYPDIPYALQLPEFEADGEVGSILDQSCLDGSRKYEKYFDFVKWFNEADGGDFDISRFCR